MKKKALALTILNLLFATSLFAATASEVADVKQDSDYWKAQFDVSDSKMKIERNRWNGVQAAPAVGKTELDDKFNLLGNSLADSITYSAYCDIASAVQNEFPLNKQKLIITISAEQLKTEIKESDLLEKNLADIRKDASLAKEKLGGPIKPEKKSFSSGNAIKSITIPVAAQAFASIAFVDKKIVGVTQENDSRWFERCKIAFRNELKERLNTEDFSSEIIIGIESKISSLTEEISTLKEAAKNRGAELGVALENLHQAISHLDKKIMILNKRIELTKKESLLKELEDLENQKLDVEKEIADFQKNNQSVFKAIDTIAPLEERLTLLEADYNEHKAEFTSGFVAKDTLFSGGFIVEIRKPYLGSYSKTQKWFLTNATIEHCGGVKVNFTIFSGLNFSACADGFVTKKDGFRKITKDDLKTKLFKLK